MGSILMADAREALAHILLSELPKWQGIEPVVTKLMAWHTTHCPQVTRGGVEKLFILHQGTLEMFSHEKFIDDLLALLNGEPGWCEHIKWFAYAEGKGWISKNHWENLAAGPEDDLWVSDRWTCCPICKTLRPTG